MRILFWNTHKNKGINPYIASLVLDNEIDILALSEYDANIDELNAMFKDNNQRLIKCNTLGCDRIDVWSMDLSCRLFHEHRLSACHNG